MNRIREGSFAAFLGGRGGFLDECLVMRGRVSPVPARPCARMSRFLVAIRELHDFSEDRRFPIVKWLFFEMESDVLKSTILQS